MSDMTSFKIVSINISTKKGEQKVPVDSAELKVDHGIVGDAHAGNWHRQISMLADEDVETMRGKGVELNFGDFAENITTVGIDLAVLPVGTRIMLGDCEVEVTQIGKECHHGCAVFQAVGDCVMPRKGIFVKVISGGNISCDSNCTYRK
ncbi:MULTISPECIES: MOSC domain-containing protein [unclassified Oceanispirochaeta]|uniref:MOSC domain-containing protein n=1 Tax=unclassified Oceanispirochaeta TaxID=2635722 RepID=UPI000E09815C|nr:MULTISPECIES: MOSC domain-containing protein [unclassified Oceanispirochaeta]MBF9015001.1 MOSC domain-containing protein [Oceanispirochaeta sp. M2]NPD71318.1 MOSC domain-containing protein [Oceanispirochaeta sp. M1]RDG33284.1 MOSC domain-containing protein [Oceanispirochaeta sp. M1]